MGILRRVVERFKPRSNVDRLVQKFLNAESSEACRALISRNPQLLTPEALFLVRRYAVGFEERGRQSATEKLALLVSLSSSSRQGPGVKETTSQELEKAHRLKPSPKLTEASDTDRPADELRLDLLPDTVKRSLAELRGAELTRGNAPGIVSRCEQLKSQIDPTAHAELYGYLCYHEALAQYLSPRGGWSENIERGLECLKQADGFFTRDKHPDFWSEVQSALGMLHIFRVQGDREQNLQKAIRCLENSLEVLSPDSHPEMWASAKNNLGIAYSLVSLGDPVANRQRGIAHQEQALAACRRERAPVLWADISNNLGLAIVSLPLDDPKRNVEAAIGHYRAALEVRQAEKAAETECNWALILLEKATTTSKDYLGAALIHANKALDACPYQTWREQWARIKATLGRIHALRATENPNSVETALLHFDQALKVQTPEMLPGDCLETCFYCGSMLYGHGQLERACEYLRTGHEAAEILRSQTASEQTKHLLSERLARLYARLVVCCLRLGSTDQAYLYASAAKSRALVDALSSAKLDLQAVAAKDSSLAEQLSRLKGFQQEIAELRAALLSRGDDERGLAGGEQGEETRGDLRTKVAAQKALWDEISLEYPPLLTVQAGGPLSGAEAREIARVANATLVEFYQHEEGWGAFVVTPSDLSFVELPGLTDEFIRALVRWPLRAELPSGRGKLSLRFLGDLYRRAFSPITGQLARDRATLLAPHGPLHLVPLAAALNPETGRYLSEDYAISFAPSLTVVRAVGARNEKRGNGGRRAKLLGIASPGEPGSNWYLPNAALEVQEIGRYFPYARLFVGKDATVSNVTQAIGQWNTVHFGCHGVFDPEYPEESGLLLADGWLTVRQILSTLDLRAQLVTIGACLGGQARVRGGDEFTGLTQALLCSGANAVASSLWSVDDRSTRAYFETFYSSIAQGFPVIAAARAAGAVVRSQPGWKHPYYWAAFQVYGLLTGCEHTAEPQLNGAQTGPTLDARSRGDITMQNNQILSNFEVMIGQMCENPGEVLKALTTDEREAFAQGLDWIHEAGAKVRSEPELLAWATQLLDLVNRFPDLRDLLVEEETDLAGLAHRKISEVQFVQAAQGSQETVSRALQMRNTVLECRNRLIETLKDERLGRGIPKDNQ